MEILLAGGGSGGGGGEWGESVVGPCVKLCVVGNWAHFVATFR